MLNLTRRQFVRSAASASAVIAAPFILRAEQTSQRKFTTALIGSGYWGKNVMREAIASQRCQTEKPWAAPVRANGRIYVRNAVGDVVCLDVRRKAE